MRILRIASFAAWSLLLAVPMVSYAQTTIYNSGGFEAYNIDTLSPQDNWNTTDGNQFGTPAGIVQSTTTFAGTRAVQVIGQNLLNDITFSNQTFWWQDRVATPINPVAQGTPIIRTTWRQFVTGTTGDLSQMPFVGIYFEGLTAGGTQQSITSIFYDNADRISAITTNGNLAFSAVIPNSRNTWLDMRADFNFSTQRFSVFANNSLVINNQLFRNTNGPTNRIVEFGFQASAIDLISPPPTNDAFYDDYLVVGLAAVPEPTTYALGGLTILGALGFWRYRSKRNQKCMEAEVQPVA
jgi:PEP-CTERM motif